ncbi:MAG: hypothetical protein ACTS3R_12595 [Inquilinaceae bacterium]
MLRLRCAIGRFVVAVILVGPATAVAQEALPISAFAGSWTLNGDVGDIQTNGIALGEADLDVVVEVNGDGFRISWVPIRLKETDKTLATTPRRQIEFVRTAPKVFRVKNAESPLESGSLIWARIAGSTLTVYDMHIAAMGGFEIVHDARTVTGDEMIHEFLRIGSEGPEGSFTARLERTAR